MLVKLLVRQLPGLPDPFLRPCRIIYTLTHSASVLTYASRTYTARRLYNVNAYVFTCSWRITRLQRPLHTRPIVQYGHLYDPRQLKGGRIHVAWTTQLAVIIIMIIIIITANISDVIPTDHNCHRVAVQNAIYV